VSDSTCDRAGAYAAEWATALAKARVLLFPNVTARETVEGRHNGSVTLDRR
jgi:hypothetical protein